MHLAISETPGLCYDARMTTDKTPRKRPGSETGSGAKKRFSRDSKGAAGRSDGRPPKTDAHPPRDVSKTRVKPPRKTPPREKQPVSDRALPDSALDEPGGRGERIAKIMARVGLCSRREAETWIAAGRVELNGKTLETPAITVTSADKVFVDGEPLPLRERTRLWLYHKPKGLVTTNQDPEGRTTVFDRLPDDLPRVLTVGRLDINTEGLLLLTNDGGLARVLELPATGWLRRYRVRAYGRITQSALDGLAEGVAIDGVLYGGIEATLDKEQGDNVWLTVGLREGKNREVKRVLEHLGLSVNRLIRLSFGPFQLQDLDDGAVREIRGRVLRDQLGDKLIADANADFDAPILQEAKPQAEKAKAGAKSRDERKSGQKTASQGRWLTARDGEAVADKRKSAKKDGAGKGRPRKDGRKSDGERPAKVSPRSRFRLTSEPRPRRDFEPEKTQSGPKRRIWSADGLVDDKQQESRTGADKQDQSRDGRNPRPSGGGRGDRDARPSGGDGRGGDKRSSSAGRGARDGKPRGDHAERGKRPPRGGGRS